MPDDKLGVAVAITKDGANAVAERIAMAALRLHAAARERHGAGRTTDHETAVARARAATRRRVRTGSRRVDLVARDSTVHLTRTSDMMRSRLRVLAGDTLIVDDELSFGQRRSARRAMRLVVGTDTLARATRARPQPLAARWRGLIGEYGWDYNTLYILEREGRLHALIEWFFDYPLTEIAPRHVRVSRVGPV